MSVIPAASSLILKALNEPERDRKKVRAVCSLHVFSHHVISCAPVFCRLSPLWTGDHVVLRGRLVVLLGERRCLFFVSVVVGVNGTGRGGGVGMILFVCPYIFLTLRGRWDVSSS